MADAYVSITFVADELLTSTKMNQLAANQANFHNGTALGDGIILTRHISNTSVKASNIDYSTIFLQKIITATAGSNYNSTSFTDITQLGSTNITAPSSGKVRVTGVFTISNQTTSIPDNFVQILVGASASRLGKLTTPVQYQGGNVVVDDVITGLTPGNTYAVKAQYKNSSGTNVYIDTPYCGIIVYAD